MRNELHLHVGLDLLSTSGQQYLSERLLWTGISLGVSFAIVFYIPFALSIPLAIGAFILLNIYFRKKIMRIMSMRFNSRPAGSASYSSSSSLNYSCINCETRHNETFCPKRGSKIKRADFHGY